MPLQIPQPRASALLLAGNITGSEAYGWREPAARQGRKSVAEDSRPSEQTELLTVVELAARLKCSPSFIYRRLNPSHPQYVPHTRPTPSDIRFNSRVIADLLPKSENASVSLVRRCNQEESWVARDIEIEREVC